MAAQPHLTGSKGEETPDAADGERLSTPSLARGLLSLGEIAAPNAERGVGGEAAFLSSPHPQPSCLYSAVSSLSAIDPEGACVAPPVI